MLEFLSRRSRDDSKSVGLSIESDFDLDESDLGDLGTLAEPELSAAAPGGNELENLMNSIKQQSVEISCEFASLANWSSQIEMLSARAATLQPMLKSLVEKSTVQASALTELSRNKDSAERRISELEAEVQHYRPLAARFEEDLRVARDKFNLTQASLTSLEGQYSQAQAYSNELMHKLSVAESRTLRVTEENVAFKQKALEHNAMIQSLLREVANLKSSIAIATSEVEKQSQEIASLTQKLAAEKEASSQTGSNMSLVLMREARMEKDLKMRLNELEEQQQELVQKLAIRDKQLYEAEIKNSAITSKVEFLTQLNHRLREDLRGQMDHTSMMEVSNRQLLEAMTHRRIQDEDYEGATRAAKPTKPKLRAIQGGE